MLMRIRKIKWAIGQLERMGVNVTVYKVQLYAGFGGNNKEVAELISALLESTHQMDSLQGSARMAEIRQGTTSLIVSAVFTCVPSTSQD